MTFDIQTYRDEHAPAIAELFNEQTRDFEHIIAMTADRFRQRVAAKPYFEPAGFMLAFDGRRLTGFVHACAAPHTETPEGSGPAWPRIVMLLFDSSRPQVGVELTRRATDWLRQRSDHTPTALHPLKGYPFYRGHWLGGEPQLPFTMPHVQMALATGGYQLTHQDVFMVAPLIERPRRLEPTIDVQFVDAPTKPKNSVHPASWEGFAPSTVDALIDGKWVGECGYVVLPEAAAKLGRPSMNIWNLAVEASVRRRGIAAALISRAHLAAWEAGARSGTVCTQLDNAPAHATYLKCGYRPHTVVGGRTWEPAAAG